MTERQIAKELERQKVLFDEQVKGGYYSGNIKFQDFTEQWFRDYAKIILSLGPSKTPWEWLKCSLPGGSFFLFLPFGVYLVFIQNVIKYRA